MALTVPFLKTHRSVHRLLILTGVALLATSVVAASTQASNSSTWDPAGPVPFASGVLQTNGWGDLFEVSCTSVGNCTAGGEFEKSDGTYSGFVVSSTNGIWGEAQEVVFDSAVSQPISNVAVNSVSCASAGNCVAVGKYSPATGNAVSFILNSTNGVWGQATPVTFPNGVRNASPFERLWRVSCTSIGNCTAVGNFRNATGGSAGHNDHIEAYTVSLTNGVWGQATPVVFANSVIQHSRPNAQFYSVSCNSPGNCTAVGHFKNAAGGFEVFVTSSSNGVWSQATSAVFTSGVQPTQSVYLYQEPYSVSCASAGNCVVVGGFTNAALDYEAFILTSTNGVWGQATPPTFASGVLRDYAPNDVLASVSCASVGNCVAAGKVRTNSGREAFTISLTNGVWGEGRLAVFPAGLLREGQNIESFAEFRSISCPSVGNCTAGGYFVNQNSANEAFTMTSTNGVWDSPVPAVFGSGIQDQNPDALIRSVSCASAGNCAAVGYFKQTQVGYRALAMLSTGSAPSENPATPTTLAESGGAVTSTTVTNTSAPAESASNTTKTLPDTGSQSGLMLLFVGVCLLSLGVAVRRQFP